MPNEPVTFVSFAGDIVSYALREILNVEYEFPRQMTPHRKTFHVTIGEAATVFRGRHADQFGEMMADAGNFVVADVRTLIDYLDEFVEKNFKGKVPLMELIVFCAFLIDLAVCCSENGRTDMIDDVVAETYDVYDQHVRPYFDMAGGWLSLLRVARDYLCYVESMRKYSLLSAADRQLDEVYISERDAKDDCDVVSGISLHKTSPPNDNPEPCVKKTSLSTDDLKNETTSSIELFQELDAEYIRTISTNASKSDSEMSISSNDADGSTNLRMLANSLTITKSSTHAHNATSSTDTEDSSMPITNDYFPSEIETTDTE